MSLAPSIAVPRLTFDPLPIYIGLFCLLWSFAFVAGKIAVTDCPPLSCSRRGFRWREF